MNKDGNKLTVAAPAAYELGDPAINTHGAALNYVLWHVDQGVYCVAKTGEPTSTPETLTDYLTDVMAAATDEEKLRVAAQYADYTWEVAIPQFSVAGLNGALAIGDVDNNYWTYPPLGGDWRGAKIAADGANREDELRVELRPVATKAELSDSGGAVLFVKTVC